ncbi:MAG: tRNA pseudouridine(38-40) synthase TruA [Gammaproteobacteria bacterium]|nr:tRNA pseudouridine(38-40) synthase TruA [Gammaproteobacteria bacterium]
MKFAAGIEYKGTAFDGWQSQSHAPNVQDCIEQALTKVADSSVRTVCAGRTDSGVHATGQVVHFETVAVRRENEWLRGCNANMDKDVAVRWVCAVNDDFDARKSAIKRHYRYIILNTPQASALLNDLTTHIYKPLDAKAMHRAAQALIGEHDFSSFRSAGCQSKTPIRHVYTVEVKRNGRLIYIDICANAFVQYMVRNIVGVLIEVGDGTQPAQRVAEVLAKRDRTQGGITAPSNGLYLVRVEYEACYGLPDEAVYPSFY